MRALNCGLLALLVLLQLTLWVGEGSIGHYVSLQRQITELNAGNTVLSERNNTLALEVYNLQNGYDVIEAYARTQLGMIKSDETFYLVISGNTHEG
ncbi:MAG: septum formation initiator family protein [Sinobacterium sp.]|nr:septum formation initiator family protein [Sinobacterium sp.]